MNDTFKCMLQLFLQTIRLKNVDDADEKEQSFAFIVTCWNASGTAKNPTKSQPSNIAQQTNELVLNTHGTSSSSSIGSLSAWILSIAVEWATKRCRFIDL